MVRRICGGRRRSFAWVPLRGGVEFVVESGGGAGARLTEQQLAGRAMCEVEASPPNPRDIDPSPRTQNLNCRHSRCSTSRNARMPPSEVSWPPSNLTTIGLPLTDDKPGSGSIGSFMAGVVQLKSRELGFDNQILREIRYLGYIRQPSAHNTG